MNSIVRVQPQSSSHIRCKDSDKWESGRKTTFPTSKLHNDTTTKRECRTKSIEANGKIKLWRSQELYIIRFFVFIVVVESSIPFTVVVDTAIVVWIITYLLEFFHLLLETFIYVFEVTRERDATRRWNRQFHFHTFHFSKSAHTRETRDIRNYLRCSAQQGSKLNVDLISICAVSVPKLSLLIWETIPYIDVKNFWCAVFFALVSTRAD